MEECAKENNVDEKYTKLKELKALPDEPNIKCFVKCTLVKAGKMDVDGTIHKEAVIEKIRAKYSDHLPELEKCLDVTNEDPCEKAYVMHKCIMDIL